LFINVVDNFYKDPHLAREQAIKTFMENRPCREITPWDRVFCESGYHIKDSEINKYDWKEIFGCEVTSAFKNRHFNLTIKNPYNTNYIHYDDYDFIGLIYLNIPSQLGPEDGTKLLKHRTLGHHYMNDEIVDEWVKAYSQMEVISDIGSQLKAERLLSKNNKLDHSQWDITAFIPSLWNRALFFEPRYLHSESYRFGDDLFSGRIVEVVFFNKLNRGSV